MVDTKHSEIGYEIVNSQTLCQLTRFRLRRFWSLVPFYRWYRRVRTASKDIDGLLATAFLIENWQTCYTLSLWRDMNAMLEFNAKIFAHVDVANASFRYLHRSGHLPEIWSAQFRLSAVSSNLRWPGVDVLDGAQATPDRECGHGR